MKTKLNLWQKITLLSAGTAAALGIGVKQANADNLFLLGQTTENASTGGCAILSNDKATTSIEYWSQDNETDWGIRLPVKGKVTGYTTLYGTTTDKGNFFGVDSNLKYGNFIFGNTFERDARCGKDITSVFAGYEDANRTAKLQLVNEDGNSRQDISYWQNISKVGTTNNLVGIAYRNQEDKEMGRIVFGSYPDKIGEGFGQRTWVQSDTHGNTTFDSIITPVGSNLTRLSMYGIVDNVEGRAFDPSAGYVTFNDGTIYLPQRGKTALEVKAVTNRGKDPAYTVGVAQNFGRLGLSYHRNFANNNNKATDEITAMLNLPKGFAVRCTKLANENYEARVIFSKDF